MLSFAPLLPVSRYPFELNGPFASLENIMARARPELPSSTVATWFPTFNATASVLDMF
jgi:hypothetical protein